MLKRNCLLMAACLASVFAAVLFAVIPAKAQESSSVGTLQQIMEDADIKAEPDKEADTLASLKAGTNVVVYGDLQGSWSRIQYQGTEGYIESAALGVYQAENSENLEEEFREVEERGLRTVDEYELAEREKRTSTVWKIVIVLLVIAIFGVGTLSIFRKNRGKEKK